MRRLSSIAALALLLAGCSSPCKELGDRVCECIPVGTSVDSCKREVDNMVKSVDPTKDQEQTCSDLLDSCSGAPGVEFCDWIQTETGKVACGLAYPSTATTP